MRRHRAAAMNKWVIRVVAGLLSVFFVVYVGYQAFRFFYSPYQTETVISYSVQDSLRSKGIFIRDETVLSQPSQGVVSYVFEDAARVAGGETVAQIYPDMLSANNQKQYAILQTEIDALEACQSQAGLSALKADSFNKQINESIGKLIDARQTSDLTGIGDIRASITENLNKKQIITGTVTDFSQRISQLRQQQEQLDIASASGTVTAPESGYFASYVDGFESTLSTQQASELSAGELDALIASQPQEEAAGIGKIITDDYWYFAVTVSKEEAKKFSEGIQVELDFGITSFDEVPVEVTRMTQEENGRVGVVFRGNYMSAQLAQMRIQSVEINFKRYTGLRLNKSAIHYSDASAWVYKVSGLEMKKVPVEILYEGIGYVIIPDSQSETNQVSLFDQVITEGTDLYDGKTVH